MSFILIILLVLLIVGALPQWGWTGPSYYPAGGLGLVLVVVLVLVLLGHF